MDRGREEIEVNKYPIATHEVSNLITAIANLLGCSAAEKGKSLLNLLSSPRTFHEAILFDNFKLFLTAAGESKFDLSLLTKLGNKLAEISPNDEAKYTGDEILLSTYAKKIIKIIWECDSEEKAKYSANLTRALINGYITKEQYFKLTRCVTALTEGDLQIIGHEAKERKVITEQDYIEEFTGLGLLYPVVGGSCYSNKALLLRNYAIQYEYSCKSMMSSESIPRFKNDNLEIATEEDIERLFKNG